MNQAATELGLQFEAARWLPMSVVIIVCGGVLIWAMQRKKNGGRWSGVWRWVAVSCLAIALAKPVIIRAAASGGGEWLVLLDQSKSMSVSDPQQSPANRVALAQAAGMLKPQARPWVGTNLVDHARAMSTQQDAIETVASEVEFAELSGHGNDAAVTRLKVSLQSMRAAAQALQQMAVNQPNAAQLFDVCRAIIRQVDAALSQTHLSQAVSGGREADWLQLLRRLVNSAIPAAEQPQEVADSATYRGDSEVRAAADQVAESSRIANASRVISRLIADPPSGVKIVVRGAEASLPPLVIDPAADMTAAGETTDTNGAIAAAEKNAASGDTRAVILFSDGRQVGSRPSSPPLNLPIVAVNCGVAAAVETSLLSAELPDQALLHELVCLHVSLESRGSPNSTVKLEISDADQKWVQTVNCSPGRFSAIVPLCFDSPGRHQLLITACRSTPEPHPQNNTLQRSIRVFDRLVQLSLLSGAPGEDVSALQDGLRHTRWIHQQDFALKQPASDVVILHDVQTKLLDPSQWTTLVDWVKRGGGLILIAGPDTSAAELQDSPANAFLPWRNSSLPMWHHSPAEGGGFHVVPADGSIIARFSDDLAENRNHWEQLPGLRAELSIDSLRQSVQPLLSDANSGQAVVTEQRLDAGRVVFVGFEEAFRWRNLFNDQDADHFWHSLIRHVAEPAYAAQDHDFELDAEPSTACTGKAINIRVKSRDENKVTLPTLRLVKDGKPVTDVSLQALASNKTNTRYLGTLNLTVAGDYQLQLLKDPPLILPIQIKADDEAEMANLNPDENYLRRIARASGGAYLRLDEMPSFSKRFDEMMSLSPHVNVMTLWDSALLYWVVLGCLILDWASRKRAGLF